MQRECTIVNERGLHARAAVKLAKLAESFDAAVTVSKDGLTVCGTSILGLMLLTAGIGSAVVLEARGSDEQAALDALAGLIERGFGEDN